MRTDTLLAPAPPALLARAIYELSTFGIRITPLTVACFCTDAGASDDEVQRALDKLPLDPTEQVAQ